MRLGIAALLVAAAAVATGVGAAPSKAATSLGLGVVPGYEAEQPAYAWEGSWQEHTVTWKSSATGAELSGVVFAPNPLPVAPVPGVVIVPGSGPGVQSFYQWAARDLAGHGYEALTVDPQGVGQSGTFGDPPCSAGTPAGTPAAHQETMCPGVPFQQDENYVDAAGSGIDFLVSGANPYQPQLDPAAIGLAGHSLGARAVSWLQGADARVKAVAAWDNLASDLNGDAGSPSGGPPASEIVGGGLPGTPAQPVTPRVPALGEASDSQGVQTTNGPEIKKTAYDVWQRAGVPSMEVVFAGAQHLDWAQTRLNSASNEASLFRFEFYTRAWFDLFLRNDQSAVARLTASDVDATPRRQVMSSKFRSALSLPQQGIECPDLAGTTCP
jgi:dienelactone hydrolase